MEVYNFLRAKLACTCWEGEIDTTHQKRVVPSGLGSTLDILRNV